jgi:LysR family transcriptional regulator, transcriptional activator of nhaA
VTAQLNYHHLHYFWAVAREGNLTRAAEKLHVSQSAVSVQIKKLEESLGRELFERTGRQLALTEAGRVALDYADSIFDMGRELLGVLESQRTSAQRSLRVGVLATLSRNFQLGFLAPLLNRDDATVLVRSGPLEDILRRLEAHQLDVVLTNVVPARTEASSWVPHTIDEQPVSLISRPSARRARSLRALLAEEPIVVATVESSIRTAFDALAERLDVTPRVVAEVDDMAMLRLLAREHRGVTVIPPIVVQDELADGTLVELTQLPGLVEPFSAITVPRRAPNPLLLDLLLRAQQSAERA